jgi:glycosyltransferase involved in cell wall biosynthesis
MKKSIKILSEYFYPEPTATGKLTAQLAGELSKKGFNVEIYTCRNKKRAKSKVKLPRKEIYNGVKINRLPSIYLNKENLLFRKINWLSFSFNLLISLSLKSSKDILLVVSSPPVLPFVALFFNVVRGQRFIPIIYDIYPDIAVALEVAKENGLFVKLWKRLNNALYRRASRIVVISKQMKQTITRNTAADSFESKIKVIYNWENPEFIKPLKKEENTFAKKNGYNKVFTVLYSGNFGMYNDLCTIIYAAEKVQKLPIKFVFIGDGAQKEKLKKIVRDKDLKNVDFYPYQAFDKLPLTLTCADISVVSEDKRVNGLCSSSKLYSSLASGRAVLAMVNKDSDIADTIRNCNCGFIVNQGDINQMVNHLKFYLKNRAELKKMGKKARKYFEENYTIDHSIEKYVKMLKEVK